MRRVAKGRTRTSGKRGGLYHCDTLRYRAQRCTPLPSPVPPGADDGQDAGLQCGREFGPGNDHFKQFRLYVLIGCIRCTAFCSARGGNGAVSRRVRTSFESCPRHFDLWHNDVRSRTISHKPLLVRGFCRFLPAGTSRCVRLLRCILRCALSPVRRAPTTHCFPVLCSSSPCSAINHRKPEHFSTEHNCL